VSFPLQLDTWYILKMRVSSTPDEGGLYKVKAWVQGQAEPAAWTIEHQEDADDLSSGGVVLLTWLVDATFGDVTVTSLEVNPEDDDSDGVDNATDNCPTVPNPGQQDGDSDGTGDACDPCVGNHVTGDADGDGVCDDQDACDGDDAGGDTDGDGVCNDSDACPNTVPGATVDASGCSTAVPGDFDGDGDVDFDDFGNFQLCHTGSNQAPDVGCEIADLDRDNDVDQLDFGAFQRCYRGVGVPVDPSCAD
jgi:hypothetical protein